MRTHSPRRDAKPLARLLLVAVICLLAVTSSAAGSTFAPDARRPVNKSKPTVSGKLLVNETLTASTGNWSGSPTGFAYQWQRCNATGSSCADIALATTSAYTLTTPYVGSTMRVVVTAFNSAGTAKASSAPTGVVGGSGAPVNSSPPSTSGSATVGATLVASPGTWSGSPSTYGYQWRTCDAAGASCSDVAGSTSSTYVVKTGDVGRTLRVVVTASNSAGSGSAASAPSPVVAGTGSAGCTLYVAPNGSSGNSGATPDSPLTIAAANSKSVPGSVICLAAGNYRSGYVQVHSGTPSAWIIWRSYNGDPVITWDTSQSRNLMFKVTDGAGYVEFNGLTFDGASAATAAVGCFNHSHHVRVLDSDVRFTGAAGLSMVNCDYVTVVGNTVYRFGDAEGWSSGINLNWGSGAWWFDNAPGFHNVVAGNFVTGGVDSSSYHSDGNGIILDVGGQIAPTLIANNVVYMNGGRGIISLQTSGAVYVLNNTLYKNGLDLRMSGIGEGVPNASSNQVWANNVVYAWEPRYTYQLLSGSTGITYRYDAQFGGRGTQYIASSVFGDPAQIALANPMFARPPVVDPAADGQWRTPPTVSALGNGLALQGASPLVDTAADPRTLPGLDAAKIAGIQQWVLRAVDGTQRPAGAGFDYGAYER